MENQPFKRPLIQEPMTVVTDLILSALADDDPDALWLRALDAPDPAVHAMLAARALAASTGAALIERRAALAMALADGGDLAAVLGGGEGQAEAVPVDRRSEKIAPS